MMSRIILELDWKDIVDRAIDVSEKIKNSGTEYECIISLGRGGLVPSGLISRLLGITRVYSINVNSYHKEEKGDVRIGSFPHDISEFEVFDINTKEHRLNNMLFVDDCIATGDTMESVETYIRNKYLAGDKLKIGRACLFKDRDINRDDIFYSGTYEKKLQWLSFPWELNELK